ncbi:MAG: HlyU family transcriptional regulator [Pseudotabrizicola sp.]|uniref:HlyU family transcriptional regulator n=1 Tax=Pseudotabrizicola sp. TaxID=2939647 RepID=UPI0027164B85|nr:HlyU family transcriptional regulator [Pseudotabrizicola sp.]MDO9639717.1 HlyU family transcriptional regulator [Pseudotabrizicola sp.]
MTSFLSRLFGKSAAAPPAAPDPVLHNDFRIFPDPIKEGSTFRIAARVEKTIAGEVKSHQLIRADTRGSLDEATEASVAKARQAIDQLGDTLFS